MVKSVAFLKTFRISIKSTTKIFKERYIIYVYVYKCYIFNEQFFYSVCLLLKSANKVDPKVSFIYFKYKKGVVIK